MVNKWQKNNEDKMKISKANKRDKKRFKNKHGMKVNNKSIFIIQAVQIKRANKIKNKKGKK